jgi:putative Holliday junction resolvase
VLAVDWGLRRFGVAISDPSRLIAQPLTTLTRRPKQRAPVGAVAALAAGHGATQIVVGLPLTPEGEETEAARAARAFGEQLERRSGLPVSFMDERLSTAHALKSARRAGMKDRDSRARIDQMAAVGILQAWLDRQAHSRTDARPHNHTGERSSTAGADR